MERVDMEEALLGKDRSEEEHQSCIQPLWYVYVQEVKKVAYIAGPMVAVNLSHYFLQIISIMMVGHLGKLALSSTAIATSLCAVSGFSVLYGLSCALETLCGQSYGAQQYRIFGIRIYTAIFSIVLACLPLSALWISFGKLLVFLGQDPAISHEAGKFAVCLIPALFAYGTLQALVRYFLMQSLIRPLLISASVTICFHICFCWMLVFKSEMGNLGAAFAISTSYWLNVILLGIYMKFSNACEKTRAPISMEIFQGIGEFFRLAIPSAAMVCLEWWSFELIILLSGLLPNPELETSVLSICLSILTTIYTIPEAIGSAASTRVSNELGAGNPQAARTAFRVVALLTMSEAILVSASLFACRYILGHIFSNEKDVIDCAATMAPLLALSVLLDNFHGVLSGIARGCGWQDLGAYVNLGAYYICGLPVAAILGFWLHLGGRGLWIGNLVGASSQSVLLALISSFTDWEKQASQARERVFGPRKGAEPLSS